MAEEQSKLTRAVVLILIGWLGTMPVSQAQSPKSTSSAKQSAVVAESKAQQTRSKGLKDSPEEEARPSKSNEGIKVHGHWTIEVRNPDGSFVARREFENSLVAQSGPLGLANVLGRVHSVGLWQIAIGNPYNVGMPQPCSDPTLGAVNCTVQEPGIPNIGPFDFQTLTVNVPTSGPNSGALVLSGNFTAASNSPLTAFSTLFYYCSGTVAPATCPPTSGAFTFFTAAQITPINVTAGQLVLVTVVISFS